MPYVYEHMMGLFDRINYASPNGDRLAEPDVDEGGKLDYALLEPLETIIGERWKYLHTPYYSVGYLLNPANIAVDINDAKHAPFIDELMADLELVCGRLFHGDAIKAAKAMDQYRLYKQPNSRFAAPIRQAAHNYQRINHTPGGARTLMTLRNWRSSLGVCLVSTSASGPLNAHIRS